ncbi:hypothetical protein PSI19_20740 [Xenorhabdus khoisanae]|uniref:hypothetical protein n=1 Tax=Xenorhabdus khoisanae TaxID=880157 RepID=UPI0023590859|nr:hypothetical protein [Xenorhabdus khoisanae]MDC9616235.1 hypothetical protein [Xenorhabdus khoisanae]
MRYICALLEADIIRPITHDLTMKVSRCYLSPATDITGQNIPCLTLIDTVLTGTTFTHILYLSR